MKKDIAKKWVKALRSGKYKQGKSYLKQIDDRGQDKHCCLGVLCELYNDTMKKNHKKSLKIKQDIDILADYIVFNGQYQILPKVVQRWAGMYGNLGEFIEYPDKMQSLSCLNDEGKKFSTIANIIEKNVENL